MATLLQCGDIFACCGDHCAGKQRTLQEDVPQNLQKKHIALIFLIRDKISNPVNTLLNY